jgi:hypothetical protein
MRHAYVFRNGHSAAESRLLRFGAEAPESAPPPTAEQNDAQLDYAKRLIVGGLDLNVQTEMAQKTDQSGEQLREVQQQSMKDAVNIFNTMLDTRNIPTAQRVEAVAYIQQIFNSMAARPQPWPRATLALGADGKVTITKFENPLPSPAGAPAAEPLLSDRVQNAETNLHIDALSGALRAQAKGVRDLQGMIRYHLDSLTATFTGLPPAQRDRMLQTINVQLQKDGVQLIATPDGLVPRERAGDTPALSPEDQALAMRATSAVIAGLQAPRDPQAAGNGADAVRAITALYQRTSPVQHQTLLAQINGQLEAAGIRNIIATAQGFQLARGGPQAPANALPPGGDQLAPRPLNPSPPSGPDTHGDSGMLGPDVLGSGERLAQALVPLMQGRLPSGFSINAAGLRSTPSPHFALELRGPNGVNRTYALRDTGDGRWTMSRVEGARFGGVSNFITGGAENSAPAVAEQAVQIMRANGDLTASPRPKRT